MVTDDLLFLLFTNISPLPHILKSTKLNKMNISTRNYDLSEGHFRSIWINTIGNLVMISMADSPVCFSWLANNISSNTGPNMVVSFVMVTAH